ncbi:diaminopimelate epimerase [bacterium]|nr:MAG: diaminopimelate epimerase [bacterium]
MKYPIYFTKMSGTGNDFILIDNRSGIIAEEDMAGIAVDACRRRQSVGADGLILIQDDPDMDFSWRFFNSDGSQPEMCGNGARCAARFASLNGIAGSDMTFRTLAGPIKAKVNGSSVRVQLTPPSGMKKSFPLNLGGGDELDVGFINTGVPHTVVFLESGELQNYPVVNLGREIRFHPRFAPAGTNVNFVEVLNSNTIGLRTYERGVEDETLACGTGAVASTVLCVARQVAASPVEVHTFGGDVLKIHLDPEDLLGEEVYLEGAALIVYSGQLTEETVRGG